MMPLPAPLVVAVLLVGVLRCAQGDQDDAKGLAGLAGLTGLPAGLTTLLKFRSSLPLASASTGAKGPRGTPSSSSGTSSVSDAPPGILGLGGTTVDPNQFVKPPVFPEEESWPGSCRLRSKRYVSDGLCVSPRPINEVVCAVSCVIDAWSKQTGTRPVAWRCSDSGWKRQRVRLLCRDGSTRSYRVRVVQTCRCVPRARHTNQLE